MRQKGREPKYDYNNNYKKSVQRLFGDEKASKAVVNRLSSTNVKKGFKGK